MLKLKISLDNVGRMYYICPVNVRGDIPTPNTGESVLLWHGRGISEEVGRSLTYCERGNLHELKKGRERVSSKRIPQDKERNFRGAQT